MSFGQQEILRDVHFLISADVRRGGDFTCIDKTHETLAPGLRLQENRKKHSGYGAYLRSTSHIFSLREVPSGP